MIWLIGSCPSKPSGIALEATGGGSSSADRLRVMLGMSEEDYEKAFWRVNVLTKPPWSAKRAAREGARLRRDITGKALVLGKDAWLALGLPDWTPWFSHHENFTLLPHPSGRNLMYNHKEDRETLRRIVYGALGRSR